MYKCYKIPQRITFERSYHFSILQYCPKETPTQVFPCEYNEIFKNTYFEEYLQIIVSELAICSVLFIHSYLYLSIKNWYWEPNVQSLTLYALTSQNCQTHLNSSSADEFFGVLDYFVGLALNWLKTINSSWKCSRWTTYTRLLMQWHWNPKRISETKTCFATSFTCT